LWLEAGTCEAIYALDSISVGVPARVVAWLRRKRLMVRLGGDYAWEQGVQRFGITETLDEYSTQKTPRPWRVRMLARLQLFVVHGAERVIVPSNYLGQIVESWGVSAKKVAVMYSALHPLGPLDDRTILREDFLFVGTVISSVGRLTPWKGFRTLIDVVAVRKSRGENITLVIGGDGPDRQSLERYAQEKGVESEVRFVGALTRDAMAAVIYASDIFILNTAYEGLSHQLLEVMDIGTPIITTNIGGNPELITNGIEGILVPVNDKLAIDAAITQIQSDTEMVKAMIKAAKNRVTFFKSDTVIQKMVAIFKNQEV
jgi:glycosyltransferase involved in cell wall biosynthesis